MTGKELPAAIIREFVEHPLASIDMADDGIAELDLGYPPTGDGLLGRVAKAGAGTLVAGRPDMGDFGGTRQGRKVALTYVLTLFHTIV